MVTASARCAIALVITLAAMQPAQAHPHMFFTSTARFILDDHGRLSKLRVVFLVDALNTLYTLTQLGIGRDATQALTSEQTQKIARTVLEGFGRYDFFTHLRDQEGDIALGKPLEVAAQLQQGRLGLSFLIPLKAPLVLKGKKLTLQLYDPTYFTDITIGLPPVIVGKPHNCVVSLIKASETEQTLQAQSLLAQLSREQTPENGNVGAMFADTTRVTCPN